MAAFPPAAHCPQYDCRPASPALSVGLKVDSARKWSWPLAATPYRANPPLPPQAPVDATAARLGCDARSAARCLMACKTFCSAAVAAEDASPPALLALLPPDCHERLARLIATAAAASLPSWRAAAIKQAPSLPRLQRVAWSVTMAAGSDAAHRSGVPAVQLQCDVTAQPTKAGSLPPTTPISIELGKETLGVLMEGFGRIRDQLDALASTAGGGPAAASAAAASSAAGTA